MKESDIYDKKDIYDSQIATIINDLKVVCAVNCIPMFVTVAVSNSEEGTDYKSDMVLAGSGVSLTDNRIGKLLLHLNGLDLNQTPEWVRRHIAELKDYSAKHADARRDAPVTGQALKRDLVSDFEEIVSRPSDKERRTAQKEKSEK